MTHRRAFIRKAVPWFLSVVCLSVPSCSKESTRTIGGGIYFRRIKTDTATATFARTETDLPFTLELPTGGFDLTEHKIIYASNNKITVADYNLNKVEVTVSDLIQIARPSFSPNATQVVVQARESSNKDQPEDINIYVIDLGTGKKTRLGSATYNEESPEWFPGSDKIAYFSFSPGAEGVRLHVYDFTKSQEELVISTGPALHAAISPDGKRILVPQQYKIYDAVTGAVLIDFKANLQAALLNAGYTVDDCCTGTAAMGPFPLDGHFSPDGGRLVMDGAVKKGGERGVILFDVDATGTDIKIKLDVFPASSEYSNNHNYSQLNPAWL